MKKTSANNLLKAIKLNFVLLGLISLLGANTFVIQAQVCITRPSGLVSWYRAENNAQDSVGTNHGTLENGTTFAIGKVGQSFSFDGVNDHVSSGTTTGNFGTSDFSIEFWVRKIGTRQEVFVSKREFCGNHRFYNLYADTTVGLEVDDGNGGYASLASINAVNDEQFHHVAITRQGTNFKLYLDGILESSLMTNAVFNLANNAAFEVGGANPCSPTILQPLNGQIDELSLYNRALTASEISAIYYAGSAGKCVAPPTAASVRVGGRVLSENGGRGTGMTLVTLTNAAGETRTALTNPFGYYRFEDVPTGQTYIISASSKRFVFSNQIQVINVTEELSGLNFTAASPSFSTKGLLKEF